jgi:hypothetical protein
MAQIQLDLHGERAKIDTEHFKERQTHRAVVDAASKDYLGNSGFKREKSRARFYKKEGASLSDVTQSSATGISFQKKGLADRAPGTQTGAATPEGETPTKSRNTSKTGRSSGTAAAPQAPATKKPPRRARPMKGGGNY